MEQDLVLLQNISDTLKVKPEASQRQLAKNANLSLGLMNTVLKRFVERGWIMFTNVNGRKLAYALTSEGIRELAERGKSFAVRTFENANKYNEIIHKVILDAKNSGKHKVVLYGKSNIRFLIQYACDELEILFEETEEVNEIRQEDLCLLGEILDNGKYEKLNKVGCLSLVEICGK